VNCASRKSLAGSRFSLEQDGNVRLTAVVKMAKCAPHDLAHAKQLGELARPIDRPKVKEYQQK
jgi:hypothetical protein